VLEVARWLHRETGAENLSFAGGTALNCSTNDRLLRETPFQRIFIPPAPSDAVTSLGCAVYGLTELGGMRCDYRWENDYLGPEPQPADIEAALRDADDLVVECFEKPADFCRRVVDLLCDTKVVGYIVDAANSGRVL
jgi:carbamoyltransferase